MLCPICSGEESDMIESGIRGFSGGQIWRCACGLEYLWPQPTADDLKEFYAGEYREDSKPLMARFIQGMHEAEIRNRRLDNLGYYGPLLEIGAGSGSFLTTWRPHLLKAYNPVFVEAVGGGYFPEYVVAVEPDADSCQWIEKDLKYRVYKSISEVPKDEKFRLIVMFHVLEHLPDPVGFLKVLKDKLAENGRIVVEVPNCDDVMLGNKAYRKKYFYQKAHLWYFNKSTLEKMFAAANMDVGVSHIQRYNLISRLRWTFRRRNNGDGQPGDLRKNWISEWYAKRLTAWGKTDTLWAVGG